MHEIDSSIFESTKHITMLRVSSNGLTEAAASCFDQLS